MQWETMNGKVKQFFEARKSFAIDKLCTLQTEGTPKVRRKPSLVIKTESIDLEPRRTHIPQHHTTKKSFQQLTHIFSPHGPARSYVSIQMRMIVAGTMKTQDSYNKVKQKDIFRVKGLVDKSISLSSTKANTTMQQSQTAQHLLQYFDGQLGNERQSTQPSNPHLSRYIKSAKTITGMAMRANKIIPTQASLGSQGMIAIATPSDKMFLKMSFRKNQDPRDGLDNFLNNKWLQFIVEQKSIRKTANYSEYLDEFMKSPKLKQQKEQIREHKLIRNTFNNPIIPMQFDTCEHRRILRVRGVGNTPDMITYFDNAIHQLEVKEDQDNLIEFHPNYYQYKVKHRRIIRKLRAICRRAVALKKSIRQLIDNNHQQSEMYHLKGSYTFLRYIKLGHIQAVAAYLESNPDLIGSYDEWQQYAIHLAVIRKDVELVKVLLSHGAEVNIMDIFEQKPLTFALLNNDLEMIKLLVANGAETWDFREKDYFPQCQSQEATDIIKFSHYLTIHCKLQSNQTKQAFFWQIQNMNSDEIRDALDQLKNR